MDLLIRDGVLVTPTGMIQADIGISTGQIEMIGKVAKPDLYTKEVDARGLWVLPGAVDGHVHLEMPLGAAISADDYFTGTRSAACGGTTTVIDCIQQRAGETLSAALERRRALAREKCCTDYAFHIGVCDLDAPGTLDSMEEVIHQGVTSFKATMVGDSGVDDGTLFRLLEAAARLNALVGVHAENRCVMETLVRRFRQEGLTSPWWHYKSRDELVEGEAVERALRLAQMAGAPLYIAPLSSHSGVEAVARARLAGQPVFAETCPQYLNFTCSVYKGKRAQDFVCAPPIKDKPSQDALWRAITQGFIDTVVSDHCPFTQAEKDWGIRPPDGGPGDFSAIPNGLGGIEVMYPYMLSCAIKGRLSPAQVVKLCCQTPARLFGLSHRKGALAVGMDADLVLFDPRARTTVKNEHLHGGGDYSVWEGATLRGQVVATYSRGRHIYKNGHFTGAPGSGQFLKCRPLRFTGPHL